MFEINHVQLSRGSYPTSPPGPLKTYFTLAPKSETTRLHSSILTKVSPRMTILMTKTTTLMKMVKLQRPDSLLSQPPQVTAQQMIHTRSTSSETAIRYQSLVFCLTKEFSQRRMMKAKSGRLQSGRSKQVSSDRIITAMNSLLMCSIILWLGNYYIQTHSPQPKHQPHAPQCYSNDECVYHDHAALSRPLRRSLSISGQELHWAMAHMFFPFTILKQPCAPQFAPQEFLMFQNSTPFSDPQPVSSTAWFTSRVVVPQLSAVYTPETYRLKPLITWKETAMGPALQSLSASSTSSPWVMLKLPCRTYPMAMDLLKTHCPSLAVQGQVTSDSSPPACLMYSKAWEGSPPLQPKFSQSPAQSTSCCSEKVMFFPLPRMFQWDSMVPTVEKAQHDPHDAWFFTGDTMPQLFHSQLSGMAAVLTDSFTLKALVAEHSWGAMSLSALNSSKVISAKSLMPCCQVSFWVLWLRMARRFSTKILNRQSDFWVQGEWNWLQISLAMSWLKGESPLSMERYLMLRCRLQRATATRAARSRIFDIKDITDSDTPEQKRVGGAVKEVRIKLCWGDRYSKDVQIELNHS